jgi:coronatine-insensitive protein 1
MVKTGNVYGKPFFSRSLKVLFLEESAIQERGDAWLYDLSLYNSSLEVLNIAGSGLVNVDVADLLAIATNCKSLISLKLNELEVEDLSEVLSKTTTLKELGGISVGSAHPLEHHVPAFRLPAGITSLVGLFYFGANEGDEYVNSLIRPIAPGLRKLDLQYACLSVDGHCQLLEHCANLEALEVKERRMCITKSWKCTIIAHIFRTFTRIPLSFQKSPE